MAYQSKYTGLQIDDILDSVEWKQGKIEDLASIRAGAQKGATALQSYTEKYTGTVTGIKINGVVKSGSGVIDLGTIESGAKVYEWEPQTDETGNLMGTLTKDEFENIRDCDILLISGMPCIKASFGNGILINLHSSSSNGVDFFVSFFAIIINGNTYAYSGSIQEVIIPTKTSQLENDSNFITSEDVAAVALSGSYNDLQDTPTIPAAVTESTVSGWGFTKNTGTVTGVKINGATKSPTSGVVDLGDIATKSDISLLDDLNSDIASLYDVKQDILVSGTNIKTINGTSILGSGNISISGGSGGGSGAYSEVSHGTADTTFTLTPNVFHIWDEVANLTLTLGSETAGVANEFLFQFNSGSTATTLTLPDTIKWANDEAPTIEANMIYQVSVLKGLASVLEFSNAVEKVNNLINGTVGGNTITAQYPVASDITIEYWDEFGDDIYTVVMLAGTSEVTTSERFGYVENLSPKEDDNFYYLY